MTIFLLLLALLLFPSALRASALSDAANAMAVGEWRTLTTTNIVPSLNDTGASGFVFGFATEMHWDNQARRLMYVGGDHTSMMSYVRYDEATNTWTRVAKPAFVVPGTGCSSEPCAAADHGWDHSAFDSVGRNLYFRQSYTSNILQKNRVDQANNWAAVTINNQWSDNTTCCDGIEWVDWLDSGPGILWYAATHGILAKSNQAVTSWSTLSSSLGDEIVGSTVNDFIECSSMSRVCIFGGGDNGQGTSTRRLYKLVQNGTITQLADAPVDIGVHRGAIVVAEPVSGKFIALTNSQQLWEFNPANDTWTQLSAIPAGITTTLFNQIGCAQGLCIHGAVGASISTYGVIAFITCQQGATSCAMHLYKHAAADSFAAKCARAGVIRCVGFDDQSMLKYAHDGSAECLAALGASQIGLSQVARYEGNGLANAMARSINGVCERVVIDTSFKRTGAGSLKLPNPNGMTQNPIYWDEPFNGVTGPFVYFGPGSPHGKVGYAQFYVYFDQNHLENDYVCVGQSCAMKFSQIYTEPNPAGANTQEGFTIVNWRQTGVAWSYAKGDGQVGLSYENDEPQPDRGCTFTVYGIWTGDENGFRYPSPPCVKFTHSQWLEVTLRMEVNAVGCQSNNRITWWLNGIQFIDHETANLCTDATLATNGRGMGTIDFSQQLSFKDAASPHANSFAWYDDLIISTQPIQMTNGIPAGATPTVAMTGSVGTGKTISIGAGKTMRVGNR